MAETLDEKALRYLAERRLRVTKVDGTFIAAECRGSDRVYQLGHDPRPGSTGWRCTCPANATFHHRCVHLRALQLVTSLL